VAQSAEAGSLDDALSLKSLLESDITTRPENSSRPIRKRIDLALAQRFTQEGDFDHARELLAPYPQDHEAASITAFLLAKQGEVDQAIATTQTPLMLDPAQGGYALKRVVLPAAESLAEYDINSALQLLDSIDRGWGDDWIRLKPALEPSICRARLFVIAGDYANALASLNGIPITDLTDALFVLQTLAIITDAAIAAQ
jgi:thioredoxin-like negative regulator of GroEL